MTKRNAILIRGPFPPPTGIVGPGARKTASHTYAIFDAEGRQIVGGTYGADREACVAHALRIAASHGLTNPRVMEAAP